MESAHQPTELSRIQRIYLTGFMGAGKSTVGALLAEKLRWQFVDVDRWIESRQGSSVSVLFHELGEAHFRSLECRTLHELNQNCRVVVSMGGGAMETEDVRSLLTGDRGGHLVFLEAPFSLLIQRCEGQGGSSIRPLLDNPEILRERFERRLEHYRMAHHTVATQFLTPEEVAASIHEHMAAFTEWR